MILELPIYWTIEYVTKPDKTVLAGMNFYRNTDYFTNNKMKKYFAEIVLDQVDALSDKTVFEGQYTLNMQLFYKNSNCDGSNIVALMEKFALDALQSAGVLKNDNVKYHLGTTWNVQGKDTKNPRCVIEVINVEDDDKKFRP